jgi:hypothetical protein
MEAVSILLKMDSPKAIEVGLRFVYAKHVQLDEVDFTDNPNSPNQIAKNVGTHIVKLAKDQNPMAMAILQRYPKFQRKD